uniref:SH3 domain-containing protein n=1 Tax=Esox lucius TaxID=8010 RepID=A0A6Q2XGM4_ESOLU
MWKSAVGHNVSVKVASEGDDWETDPDFENDVSEQEQRWGAKTIEGSGRKEHISVAELRQTVSQEHEVVKKKELSEAPKASYGYGGKFGVEKDRMDKGAMGHGYVAQVEQHSSQTDAKRGFGGKFGVQKDRVDKSAMGFEYKGEVEQHASQKDYSKGFGGKFGVEKEKVDKAALGYDYKGETEKHQSQKGKSHTAVGVVVFRDFLSIFLPKLLISLSDYSKGFGGKFGVEKEKVDKAALGYDYKGETEKHESQKDYAKGFGGRYGVQKDRMDKSAVAFTDMESPTSAYEKTLPLEACNEGAGNLKARFENLARSSDEENRKRAEEERARRQAREKREQEEARRREAVLSWHLFSTQTHINTETQKSVCCVSLRSRAAGWMKKRSSHLHLSHTPTGILNHHKADDEISFYPDDVITNIEMIDEGWWKGQCHGRFGLFPATFVRLIQ